VYNYAIDKIEATTKVHKKAEGMQLYELRSKAWLSSLTVA